MDIKTAFEKVREKHKESLLESHNFKDKFVFVLGKKDDVCLYVCVEKNTGKLSYTNFVGLEMMINGEDITI